MSSAIHRTWDGIMLSLWKKLHIFMLDPMLMDRTSLKDAFNSNSMEKRSPNFLNFSHFVSISFNFSYINMISWKKYCWSYAYGQFCNGKNCNQRFFHFSSCTPAVPLCSISYEVVSYRCPNHLSTHSPFYLACSKMSLYRWPQANWSKRKWVGFCMRPYWYLT